jgi:tRNA(Ile)-lysidine synthase
MEPLGSCHVFPKKTVSFLLEELGRLKMLKDFEKYLIETCRCSAEKNYLLAVSGGIDSVVMAHLFHLSGMNFAIAHCNFHLRGKESDDDQHFVEELAAGFKQPCYVKSFDTLSYSESRGISIQMAARDLRYSWFEELSDNYGYDFIVAGHNQNDVVETVLLNFSRGCGIRGLTGISPRHGKIIRPLLFATRGAILQFAVDNHLHWREDSSNAETKYHRNKIRHTIIPAFETINPAFMQNALDTVQRLVQTERLLDHALEQVKQAICTVLPDRYLIDIEKLKEYPAIDLLLFELLRDFGVNQISMPALLKSFGSIPGKQFHTRTHCITRDRSHLIITSKVIPGETETFIEPEIALIDYPVHLSFSTFDMNDTFKIPAESQVAAVDADSIRFPLKLRAWKQGDRFQPLGLTGTQKISDFLINSKIPMPDKKQIWIIESGGRIVWVVNHRIDNRFKITASTRKIFLMEYKG